MDSRIGLDFIVENPEYIRKLAAALDTNNVTVKKQVFELLSALCVHNEEGHARALDTLEHYKQLKGERYRLNVIVQELDRATAVDYQTALVAFINCLIISTPRLIDRVRRRNEFIGCHLLPVLNNLRKCAEAEPELAVQLDVFDEQRDSDDAQSLHGPHGVDLNSPLDVFYAILKQVAETPQEIPFLNILQHLLRIDPKDAISDIIWDTAERLVHRATLLENRDDAARILRSPSAQSKFFCHCQLRSDANLGSRRQSLSNAPLSPPPLPQSPQLGNAPIPPPPPPIGSAPLPPPPPPNIPAPPNVPPGPPPPPFSGRNNSNMHNLHSKLAGGSQDNGQVSQEKLPQQEIPTPKAKMKTFNWNKIPNNKVVGKNNVWTQVAYQHQHSPMADMDWLEMEGLFCQQAPPSAHSSPKLGGRDYSHETNINDRSRLRKENCEITLLDGKRSLNVNIFLKQFRSSNEDIIQLIRDGEHDDIGAEKLKGLLKILPEVDELDMLKSFNGDYSKLGNAEKFLIQLTNLSNYKLRIESMLLKEEFACNMSYLEPSIKSMIMAAQDLMTNKPLQEVLYMILVAGNFLNSGGYAGNAAGVKLSSLQKLTDIRANKPNMNLIHFVALQAEKKNPKLLSFTDGIGVLEDAAKTTVEQLLNEINALDVRIKKVKKQIHLSTTEVEIKNQMTEFLQMAELEVSNLQANMGELESVRVRLAEFFCEDTNSFKLEECFRIFHGFYCKFKQAVAENERRRVQEEQANARRRQREELLATKRRQMESLSGTPDSEGPFIDLQIYDSAHSHPLSKKVWKTNNGTSEDELSLTGSPSFSRRRLGSFNNNSGGDPTERSPDITPNGSLRRRRSRVLSEEDEGNLMDFLRSSGHDTNRERKSWGSLDRSWARKARGSGPRKRPALLAAEFTSDRERPSSPSPLSENKPILSAPETEEQSTSNGKPKEWRQKIESWLQANESDQVSEDTKRQNRRLTNRRSLEMDSESERSSTLDTLPEGKQVYSGSQSSYRKTYPAWKPSTTIDNTDVVGVMEAVEELQIKDKSAWRKSTLNVANSTEETKPDTIRNVRHNLPQITTTDPPPQKKEDSNDRKHLISSLGERSPTDKLTLYILNPNVPTTPSPPTLGEPRKGLGYVPRKLRESQQSIDSSISNKVEIDQDNIETPPATRKIFIPTPTEKREPVQPSPCRRLMSSRLTADDGESGTTLGDGQFDRFSAARRTRRYKRPTENTENNDNVTPTHTNDAPNMKSDDGEDKENRLKAWQDKLKGQSIDESVSKPARRYRNITGINQDDVKTALTNANSQQVPSKTKTIDIPSTRTKSRGGEHDNDEGFEETQSLMSESPSQGASSSGGGPYEVDLVDSSLTSSSTTTTAPHIVVAKPIKRASSIDSKGTSDSTTSGEHLTSSKVGGAVRKTPATSKLSGSSRFSRTSTLDRSHSSRNAANSAQTKSVIPKRSNSLKKSDSQTSIKSRTDTATKTTNNPNVQRSSSRNSIVSSRSSLNSATSTNTVKRVPSVKTNNTPSKVVQRTPSVKTLNSKNSTTNTNKSIGTTRPPRPMSFMKPTTASATKITTSFGGTTTRSSFRMK